MPLDAASNAALGSMQGGLSPDSWPIEEVFKKISDRNKTGPVVEVQSVRDITVPGHESQLPARHYRPQPKDGQHLSLLVYLHGGGFMLGGLDSHDKICRVLASGVPCCVLSIDYRLAPKHTFPAAPEDCFAATQWAAAHAEELGATSGLVAVAGDSAGGNLAAVVCILARDRAGPKLAYQLLYYPVVGTTVDEPSSISEFASMAEFGPGAEGPLSSEDHFKLINTYKPVASDTRFACIRADLKGLPPALVITCEVDPVRDEGIAYAEKLQAAGVKTELVHYDGTFHGFMFFEVPQQVEAIKASVQALRAAFNVHVQSG